MREPPVKKTLYWCREDNVPLIGRTCACGNEGFAISLQQPYDVRPAFGEDFDLIARLLHDQFGPVRVPRVMLLNKTGGMDRTDLVIANGVRFGWLSFDPVERKYHLDITPEALPFLVGDAARGIVDLAAAVAPGVLRAQRRIGGKKLPLSAKIPDGTVIIRYRNLYGTGTVRDGNVRVKELVPIIPGKLPDPDWETVIGKNRYHLKNLERNAIRAIRQHMLVRPAVNVSFSGGKDSTAVLALARKAGVTDAFFIDTGIEFPETIAFVKSQGVPIVPKGGDFWAAVEKAGPPGKDHRWCCKLLKLNPLRRHLATTGPCVTVQGNRWYESWNRADLDIASQNPDNPLQVNISPIRNWRALEVYLYLWWQKLPINPLYEQGIERIGCYLCPAMLESEYDHLRRLHPDLAQRWEDFLARWSEERGLPDEYRRWGLWRWKDLPPKMRELVSRRGIDLTGRPKPAGADVKRVTGDRSGITTEEIRRDFPLLGDIVYLDSAATSLSPEPVLQSLIEFEHCYRSNVGRGIHRLAQIATQRYWHAHKKVAEFIGASQGEVVFTKNTTEGINFVAQALDWKPGDRIVTTILEHHSNLLPWKRLERIGVEVTVVSITPEYLLDPDAVAAALNGKTRLVAVTSASNVLGVITPVREIAKAAHDAGALLLVDGAQSVPHMPTRVDELGCDFLCFSGHKMLGPTGTGVLWMRDPAIEPVVLGGGVIDAIEDGRPVFAEGYSRFEAGTPNIGGGIGLGAAVDYLTAIGMDRVRELDRRLTDRMIAGLSQIPGVHLYAPKSPEKRIGVVSFTVDGFEPHAVAHLLDESSDIMVRSGNHCCIPLMQHLGLDKGTVRASLHVYNSQEDVDSLIAAVDGIARGAR
jgi:cysteine desulfurase/selenocysteine lyase